MASSALIRLGGVAAMAGGSMWVVKGGGILLTGQQPPVVFETAMPLFAVGLLGLHARLDGRGGPLGKAGVLVAYIALASAAIVLIAPLAPFLAVAGFGPFLGLVLLGSATLKPGSSSLPGAPCRSLWAWGSPLALGGRGPRPDQRKVVGDPDRVGRALLDAAGLFAVSSQGHGRPSTAHVR